MRIVAEPIDMIARFSSADRADCRKDSPPVPCKFRYTDIAGIPREIRVDRVVSSELMVSGGVKSYIYRCQSVTGDQEKVEKIYELKYIIGECRWELYKI